MIVLAGRDLEDVVRADYVTKNEARRLPLRIRSKTHLSLTADVDIPYHLGPGSLEVRNSLGWVARTEFSREPLASRPVFSRDRFIVRFHPRHVAVAQADAETPLDAVVFASPSIAQSLRESGALSLQKVFPWFDESDVFTTNLIGERIELENLADFYYVRVAPGTDVGASVQGLRDHPAVQEAVADYRAPAATYTPDDPLFAAGKQWGLKNLGQTICGIPGNIDVHIGAESAWNSTMGSPGVSLAILDTGIDTTHTELFGRARLGPSFVPGVPTSFDDAVNPAGPYKHGTSVTGIAAATGDNNSAMAGVAWHVVPWAVKVLKGLDGLGSPSWVAQGISWATDSRIPIINMSLSFPSVQCDGDEGAPPITEASANVMNGPLLNALYAGQLSVASMGNCDGPTTMWPARFFGRVYSVGAHLHTGARWEDELIYEPGPSNPCAPPNNCPGSTFGWWIDAVAPGGRFVVTLDAGPSGIKDIGPSCHRNNPTSGWAFGGTSAAAAVVSGVAALLKSRQPALLGEDIANLLNFYAAHPLVPEQRNDFIGYGPIQGAAALSAIQPGRLVLQPAIGAGGQWALALQESLPVTQRFHNVPSLFGNRLYTAWRHRMRGTATFDVPFNASPPLHLWTRASGTWGWRDTTVTDSIIDYNEWARSGRIIGSIGTTTNTFETIVYRVINPDNPTQGVWFPCPPSQALVAFTAIGLPTTTVDVDASDPERLFSLRTHPNPAHREISLDLEIPKAGVVRVAVLDILGRQVTQLASREMAAGIHHLRWTGRSTKGEVMASGVYFLRVFYDGRTAVRRFVLLGNGR